MADREKVIKDIEQLEIYAIENDLLGVLITAKSANALLKEQEQAMKEKDGTISNLIAQIKEISQCYERVVRCKDCINCIKEPNGELYCDILAVGYEPLGSKKVTEDWFCADGERKEGR